MRKPFEDWMKIRGKYISKTDEIGTQAGRPVAERRMIIDATTQYNIHDIGRALLG